MERFERILMKLVIIQFLFLLFFQLIFHREGSFHDLKRMAQYEGVNENNLGKIIETINRSNQ
ncbi:DUF5359 family protein [Peribacillus sp. SCS-37]|uniref:DUF5359 family protein n=1 Tax=Paraperibacillus esterisolvens TaxID=3115296 RepID=UPI0039061A54